MAELFVPSALQRAVSAGSSLFACVSIGSVRGCNITLFVFHKLFFQHCQSGFASSVAHCSGLGELYLVIWYFLIIPSSWIRNSPSDIGFTLTFRAVRHFSASLPRYLSCETFLRERRALGRLQGSLALAAWFSPQSGGHTSLSSFSVELCGASSQGECYVSFPPLCRAGSF